MRERIDGPSAVASLVVSSFFTLFPSGAVIYASIMSVAEGYWAMWLGIIVGVAALIAGVMFWGFLYGMLYKLISGGKG